MISRWFYQSLVNLSLISRIIFRDLWASFTHSPTIMTGIVSFCFFLSIIVCLIYYALWAWGWRSSSVNTYSTTTPSFSILVAARNEADNLSRLLPLLLAQEYLGEFEIWVVLDRCTDESREVVQSFQKKTTRLHFIAIDDAPANWSPKKYALTQGIAACQFEHLLFTDADCIVGRNWLAGMAQGFTEGKEIVLGVSPYFVENSAVNHLIQYETLLTCLQYVGWAGLGMPYMGVGRNIAYRKSFFLANGGFESHHTRLSGDDDLFVNQCASHQNTSVVATHPTLVFSMPKKDISAWLRQKMRHISAASGYSRTTQLLLTGFAFAHIGSFFWGACAAISGSLSFANIIFLLSLKIGLGWVIFIHISRQLGILTSFLYFYPLLDVANALYQAIIIPLGMIKKPSWG